MQTQRLTPTVEFRRLLAEELAAQRQSDPTRMPRAVLDTRATSRARK